MLQWLHHVYAFAEIYTVILTWIVVPLGVTAAGMLLRRYIPPPPAGPPSGRKADASH